MMMVVIGQLEKHYTLEVVEIMAYRKQKIADLFKLSLSLFGI